MKKLLTVLLLTVVLSLMSYSGVTAMSNLVPKDFTNFQDYYEYSTGLLERDLEMADSYWEELDLDVYDHVYAQFEERLALGRDHYDIKFDTYESYYEKRNGDYQRDLEMAKVYWEEFDLDIYDYVKKQFKEDIEMAKAYFNID